MKDIKILLSELNRYDSVAIRVDDSTVANLSLDNGELIIKFENKSKYGYDYKTNESISQESDESDYEVFLQGNAIGIRDKNPFKNYKNKQTYY